MFQPTVSADIADSGEPTLQGSPRPSMDTNAWTFALIPLGALLEFAYSAITHNELTSLWTAYFGAYIALAITDVRLLKRAGLRRTPSVWWCVLAPAYLVARARVLGRGWKFVWIWAAAFVVSVGVDVLPALGGSFAVLAPTPACAGNFDGDVIRIFDTIPTIKAAAIKGSGLTNRVQTSMVGATRSCQGHVVTNAPGGHGADVSYSFERQADGQVYVRVRLLH